MIIFTHRGLEPSRKDFYPESSYEAFENHLKRGFGIEFDINFCKGGIIISHDSDLKRITNGKESGSFLELTTEEVKKIRYGDGALGRISTFGEIMELIKFSNPKINAMHLKGIFQEKQKIDMLISELQGHRDVLDKILVFDVKPEWARYLKGKVPQLRLAPSVAHEYDIERYNSAVKGTLISLKDALSFREIYDWVWLDEWDLSDEDGRKKKFYTKENFDLLRKVGYKIALVTPELHGTSPGLLGGEAHPNSEDKKLLFSRIKEIVELKPDGICTDWPEEVLDMLQ